MIIRSIDASLDRQTLQVVLKMDESQQSGQTAHGRCNRRPSVGSPRSRCGRKQRRHCRRFYVCPQPLVCIAVATISARIRPSPFVGSASDCLQLVVEINKVLKFMQCPNMGQHLHRSKNVKPICLIRMRISSTRNTGRPSVLGPPSHSKLCTSSEISGEQFGEFFFGTSATLKKFFSHLPGRVSPSRTLPPEFEGDAVQIHLVGSGVCRGRAG